MNTKAVLIGGVVLGAAYLLLRGKGAGAATVPGLVSGRVPAPVVPPANPLVQQRSAALVANVLNAPRVVSGLDANGNIVDFARYTAAVATARAQAGEVFVTPVNASAIRAALQAVISDPAIADMPVLVGSSQLATPAAAATTGVILPPSPERGTDRVNIIFPLGGGWPDVTQFPNGTNISLTGAGYVATLPAGV